MTWQQTIFGGDVSLNSCPITFGVLNARWIRNKGLALFDIISFHELGVLSLNPCPPHSVTSPDCDVIYTHQSHKILFNSPTKSYLLDLWPYKGMQ